MKLSKWEGAMLLLATAVLAFTAGWSLRGNGQAEPLRVETERSLERTSIALPAPTPEGELERVNVNTGRKTALTATRRRSHG